MDVAWRRRGGATEVAWKCSREPPQRAAYATIAPKKSRPMPGSLLLVLLLLLMLLLLLLLLLLLSCVVADGAVADASAAFRGSLAMARRSAAWSPAAFHGSLAMAKRSAAWSPALTPAARSRRIAAPTSFFLRRALARRATQAARTWR